MRVFGSVYIAGNTSRLCLFVPPVVQSRVGNTTGGSMFVLSKESGGAPGDEE
jgi:hypothetical protein